MKTKLFAIAVFLLSACLLLAQDSIKLHFGVNIIDTNNSSIVTSEQILEEDKNNMVLSEQTNSLRGGIYISEAPGSTPTNLFVLIRNGTVFNKAVSVVVANFSTNRVVLFNPWPVRDGSQFEIQVTDKLGNVIAQTSYGKNLLRPARYVAKVLQRADAKVYGLSPDPIGPKSDIIYSIPPFDSANSFAKCFNFERPNQYKMTIIRHTHVLEAHLGGALMIPISFAPITVDVRVE